nr:MAG TPA: hypothetical protein [Caudoviricetes sp.]
MALTDNPMSLVVTGNVTIGATLEASVPTTETSLLSTRDVNTTVTITVPAGVKVLKVEGDVSHEHEGEVALDVYSVNGKKYWLSLWSYGEAYDIWYVGVTPNKSYTLKLSTSSETGTESGSVNISYSQSINNQTPKVTDY